MSEELWRMKQAAEFLCMSEGALQKWAKAERVPSIRKGKVYFFLKSKLVEWLNNGERWVPEPKEKKDKKQ